MKILKKHGLYANRAFMAAMFILERREDVAPMKHLQQWYSAIFRTRVKIKFKELRSRAEVLLNIAKNNKGLTKHRKERQRTWNHNLGQRTWTWNQRMTKVF